MKDEVGRLIDHPVITLGTRGQGKFERLLANFLRNLKIALGEQARRIAACARRTACALRSSAPKAREEGEGPRLGAAHRRSSFSY